MSTSASCNNPKSKDIAWEHCFCANPGNRNKITCKYCQKVLHGITRVKNHLAGIPKDVAICQSVPDDVRKLIHGILTAKTKEKEQRVEAASRMRAAVNLSHSEGEESDDDGAQVNNIKIARKKSVGVGPLDSFCKLTPQEARKVGVKEKPQSAVTTKKKEERRDRACEYIAQWFYEAGIPHNAATLPSFDRMLEAIGEYGRGLKGPTPYELSGPLLQKRKKKVQDVVMKQRETWERTGCSIMTDGWTDKKGRGIMNLMVHSEAGVCFLKSIDASKNKKDGAYIFDMVDRCIEEIGEKNVVQIVTDTARPNQTMGVLVTAKWPSIYWTGCAAHCIDLMLEGIGGLPMVKSTIDDAKAITVFLYAHNRVLSLMREHLGKDLVRAGVTRFATAYLNLKSLLEKKDELKKLFRSDEMNDWGYLGQVKGKRADRIVRSDKFWKGVEDAVNIFEPLVEVLRRVDGDTPAMGFLYGDLLNAKREIASRFDQNEKKKYKIALEIIDKRWDDKLKTPLHLTGYYLNPYFYHSNKSEMERNTIFRGSLTTCMATMGLDDEAQDKILQEELDIYRNNRGSFAINTAKRQYTKRNFNPATWWANHGSSAPHLQRLAMRILNLTCSSSGCERNWSTFDQVHTKKRARLLHWRLNDLVYVKFNSRLLEKTTDSSIDPIEAKHINVILDENNDWINKKKKKTKDASAGADVEASAEANVELSVAETRAIILGKRKVRGSGTSGISTSRSVKKRKIIQEEEEEESDSSSSSEEEDDTDDEMDDLRSKSSDEENDVPIE